MDYTEGVRMGGETDEVRWRGIRPVEGISGVWPARDATRVNVEAYEAAGGVQTVYTVPAGKKAYITSVHLASRQSGTAENRTVVQLFNDLDVAQYIFASHYFDVAGQLSTCNNYFPALEALAGWYIKITVVGAALDTRTFIRGWTEDV